MVLIDNGERPTRFLAVVKFHLVNAFALAIMWRARGDSLESVQLWHLRMASSPDTSRRVIDYTGR